MRYVEPSCVGCQGWTVVWRGRWKKGLRFKKVDGLIGVAAVRRDKNSTTFKGS